MDVSEINLLFNKLFEKLFEKPNQPFCIMDENTETINQKKFLARRSLISSFRRHNVVISQDQLKRIVADDLIEELQVNSLQKHVKTSY